MNELNIPPSCVEHEKSVIATALLRKDAMADILTLADEDIYFANYRTYLNAIKAVDSDGVDVSLVTVYDRLRKMKNDSVAEEFLQEFMSLPAHAGIAVAVDEIRNLADKRRLWRLCEESTRDISNNAVSSDDIMMKLDAGIHDIQNRRMETGAVYGSRGLGWDRFVNSRVISTGIEFLDEIIRGFRPSQLIILGARPSIGKTAFALLMALNVAKNGRVLFITLEMDFEELELRQVCVIAHIDMERIEKDDMNDEERRRFISAENELQTRSLIIIEKPMSLQEIKSEIRREHIRSALDLVVVDYLQLIETGTNEDRHLQVAKVTRTLKLLAKEIKTPIVAISQLNRVGEGVEPELHHLRESGAIEQDANMVIFLHEPKGNDVYPGYEQLIIAKNRQGRIGKKDMFFDKKHQNFKSA